MRLVLKEISDIERVLSRVALGSARPRDLVQLRQACAQIPYLRHALQPIVSTQQSTLIQNLNEELGDFHGPASTANAGNCRESTCTIA